MVDPTGIPDLFGYRRSGRWFGPASTSAGAISVSLSSSILYAVPFFTPKKMTFDAIGVTVSGALLAGYARLGIYSDDGNGYPNSLVLDAGEISIGVDETGDKTISINVSITGLNWLVWLSSLGFAIYGIAATAIIALLGGAYPGSTPYNQYRKVYTYGALPTTFPSGATPFMTNVPLIALRKA